MGERENWSIGVVEYWSIGVLEYWSIGVLEWWGDGVRLIRAPRLCALCVFVVKFFFYFCLPFTVADFAHDSQYGMVWLIFQCAD